MLQFRRRKHDTTHTCKHHKAYVLNPETKPLLIYTLASRKFTYAHHGH